MKETLTLRVCVSGLVETDTPQLAFSKRLSRKGGKEKIYTQMVTVTDPFLLARLREEVEPGDELDITVETDWSAEGVPTLLTGFSRVDAGIASRLLSETAKQAVSAKSA
jgi:hypothetical protein